MIAQRDFNFLSPESYLDRERQATVKHEYIDGEIYAMAGASAPHIQIVGNLYAALRSHLRGTGCDILFSDIKVRIDTKNCFYYPDLIVTCDDHDRENDHYRHVPKLIVEVLSDSTEARDRGDKFEDYSTLDSLQEYALIAQKKCASRMLPPHRSPPLDPPTLRPRRSRPIQQPPLDRRDQNPLRSHYLHQPQQPDNLTQTAIA